MTVLPMAIATIEKRKAKVKNLFICRSFSAADGRFSYPGSTPHYAPDRTFDTQHIRLELTLDFPRKTLKGRCLCDAARDRRWRDRDGV